MALCRSLGPTRVVIGLESVVLVASKNGQRMVWMAILTTFITS